MTTGGLQFTLKTDLILSFRGKFILWKCKVAFPTKRGCRGDFITIYHGM